MKLSTLIGLICNPHQIYSGDRLKKDETVGACVRYGGGERCIQGFGGET